MSVVVWLVMLLLVIVSFFVGYGVASVTGIPLVEAVRERQRVEREMRLAELRLRRLSHEAMQRMLREARQQGESGH